MVVEYFLGWLKLFNNNNNIYLKSNIHAVYINIRVQWTYDYRGEVFSCRLEFFFGGGGIFAL